MNRPMDEKSLLENMAKKLRPRFHNQSVSQMFHKFFDIQDARKQLERQTNAQKREECAQAARIYLYIVAEDAHEEFRDECEKRRLRYRRDAHLLVAIVRTIEDNKDLANMWSNAIRYAIREGVEPDDMPTFFKENHGISGCADRWRELNSAPRRQRRRPKRDGGRTSTRQHRDVEVELSHNARQQLDRIRVDFGSPRLIMEGPFSSKRVFHVESVRRAPDRGRSDFDDFEKGPRRDGQ